MTTSFYRFLVSLTFAVLCSICSVARADDEPTNFVRFGIYGESLSPEWQTTWLGPEAFSPIRTELLPPLVLPSAGPLDVRLAQKLLVGDPREVVDLLVLFKDSLAISPMPRLRPNQPRDSSENQRTLQQIAAKITEIQALRHPTYERRRANMEALGCEVHETFWLIDAMRVTAPLAAVRVFLAWPDLQHVSFSKDPVLPPSATPDGNPLNDALHARENLNSFFLADYSRTHSLNDYTRLGMLDTGVRRTQTVFSGNPSRIDIYRDCVNGTLANCTSGQNLNPDDNYWNHGTASAALMVGNANLGTRFAGITEMRVNSWKVYSTSGGDKDALVRAFSASVAAGDDIILANYSDPLAANTGTEATAAQNAYYSGAVVVAPVGNNLPETTSDDRVGSPALSRAVLGIGAYYNADPTQVFSYQARGPVYGITAVQIRHLSRHERVRIGPN